MPNKYNISFSLWTAILMIMLVYIPCKFGVLIKLNNLNKLQFLKNA